MVMTIAQKIPAVAGKTDAKIPSGIQYYLTKTEVPLSY
jgi:hypothetical protein